MPRRHRRHSTAFKRQVVEEHHSGTTLHALGKKHDICRQLIGLAPVLPDTQAVAV
jgi:transposase